MNTSRFLAVLLVASVGINLYMLTRAVPSPPATSESPRTRSSPSSTTIAYPGGSANTSSTSLRAQADSSCEARAEGLQAQVAELKKDLRDHLAPDERFKLGEPDPESADRMRSELARILGPLGLGYNLDCRDRVCRLAIHVPEGNKGGGKWEQLLQSDDKLRKVAGGWEFYGGEPGSDPATGKAYMSFDTYALVNDPDAADGAAIVRSLVDSFEAGSSLADCTTGYHDEGSFEAKVGLTDKGWSFSLGGTLAGTPAGQCLADRLRAAASAVSVPSPVTSAVSYVRMQSPPK